jgi:serine/threonine-protein kinase
MATQRLGKYEIVEELGSGGFATVFRAHDTTLRRDVALKILHQVMVADPDFVRRFENDARAAANLEHPRIVTVHEMGQLEQRFYIAMQFLPGGSLDDRIKREGALSFEDAVVIIQQVAEALDYAHQKGFVHRDIKPTNILFDAQGEAVVSDFGLVKAAESSVVARSTAGGIVGTPAYIAPEAWEEEEISPATDVYALGCVFFEMLTGKRLFKGETSPAVMMAHFRPPEYPEQWPEGVPPKIREILDKALAQDPDERYASAGAFAADLQNMTGQTPDPLAEPYKGLKAALSGGRWDFALRRADEIMAQNPEYRDVQALRKRAAEGKAASERAQWAAQWREKALEAEQQGDVEAARVAAKRWLDMAPESPEAKALLERLKPVAKEPPPGPETEPQTGQPPPAPPVSRPQPPADRTTGTGSPEKSGLSQVPVWGLVLGGMALGGMAIIALIVGIALSQGRGSVAPAPATPTPLPPTATREPSATSTPVPSTATQEPSATPTTPVNLQSPPANASLGDTWTRPADEMVMVYVPAGAFEMGSTEAQFQETVEQCVDAGNERDDCEGWFGDEKPAHTVSLDGFWIDKYEVTNAQFAAFLNEEGNQEEGGATWLALGSDDCLIEKSGGEFQPKSGYADHPVVDVSWYGARAYAEWVGGQLPSEAEWEYAARGSEGQIYPWGNEFDGTRLNFCDVNCAHDWRATGYDDGYEETAPVGSFPDGASWCGALDMAGNVWEWVADWYDGDYYARSPSENPGGPEYGSLRVVRGGAFYNTEFGVRCAVRLNGHPHARTNSGGFRVVVSPFRRTQ